MGKLDESLSVEEKVEALEKMLESKGWKLLCETMDSKQDNLVNEITSGQTTADQRALAAGILRGCKEMRAWPDYIAKYLRARMEAKEE